MYYLPITCTPSGCNEQICNKSKPNSFVCRHSGSKLARPQNLSMTYVLVPGCNCKKIKLSDVYY